MEEEYKLPEPTSFAERDVFEYFGIAAYYAQVFERAVMLFAVAIQTQKATELTREFMQELLNNAEKNTIGRLLTIARELIDIPEEFDIMLKAINEKRIDLVHYFFFRHAEDFMSFLGRKDMIAELIEKAECFIDGDSKLEKIYEEIMVKYGVTPELVEKAYTILETRAKIRDSKDAVI